MESSVSRAHWSGRLAFILAAAGSAVGLGNMWKFPYIAGTNGGGAFVLVYLACIALVGVPIFIAELYIGQKTQKNAIQAFEAIDRPGSPWRVIGLFGIVSAVLILSFYSVVGGWVLDFEYRSIVGEFLVESDEQIGGTLGLLIGDPLRQIFWHSIFMALVVGITVAGVKSGLERWNKILMPGLMFLLLLLLVYSFQLEGFQDSLSFMFSPDFSKLTAAGMLEAVGHSFFTLSLGMGAILTYGSYLKKDDSLAKIAFTVAFLDTLIAVVAGLIIFSVVFTFDTEPGAGPTLMFKTLPMLFVKLPWAYVVSVAFFLLVAFAAVTSAVSLLEVIVAYWDEKFNVSRRKATLIWGLAIYVLGLLSALSYNILADIKIFGLSFFDLFDKVTSQYLLPLGGLFIAIFFGWKLGSSAVEKVVGSSSSLAAKGLLWSARLVAPAAVLVIIVNKIWVDFTG